LMTILSDNTATNLMHKRLGIGNINDTLRMLGAEKMTLNRLLFDREASSRGIENYITAREAGLLLKRLYDGEAVSGPASEDMLSILKDQRLNGKIPFLLPHSVKIAHKTGEDDGITHDVGIVYARQPFIVCFCGEHVSPPEFERAMQDITLMLYENAERIR
ncbi:MAG: serine hydrolase, partial [Ruthenibacterium lactatiformans]